MEKDIKIINEKLNMIFRGIMEIRRNLATEKVGSDVKELECKVKYAQDELESRKNNIRWDMDYLEDQSKQFWELDREFFRAETLMEERAVNNEYR